MNFVEITSVSPFLPTGIADGLRITPFLAALILRSVRAAPAPPKCAWSARRRFWIMPHEIQLIPATSNSPNATYPAQAPAVHHH
jgi:hypothetical protein